MKKIKMGFVLLQTIFLVGLLVSCGDNNKDTKMTKIADNFYVLIGSLEEPNKKNKGFMNNPAIIIDDSGVIVVDSGGSYVSGNIVLDAIKKMTDKPVVAVFSTHIHGDHWLGNQAILQKYPNAKTYAHPKMIKQANGDEGIKWQELIHKLTGDTRTKMIAPKIGVVHKQVINIGKQKFVIHHPNNKAHTNTDIMIEHINSKTLITGDNAVLGRLGMFDSSSNITGNIKTLEYAKNLDIDNVVPGHGAVGNKTQVIDVYLNYLTTIKKVVKKGYADGMEDYKITDLVTKALPDHKKNWANFKDHIGKHVNKMFLETEADEFAN